MVDQESVADSDAGLGALKDLRFESLLENLAGLEN